MNERAVVGGVLKANDMMPNDKEKVGAAIDMLLCPSDSECGLTMVAAINHAQNAITYERFRFEHTGYISEPEVAQRIMLIKDQLWELLETLYYG